jgi:hypothetical protein
MPRERFERGAVVAYLGRHWLIWNYPRGRFGNPRALPIVPQTGPLHRSHARLPLKHRAARVVHTLDPQQLPGRDCVLVGQLDPDTITAIDRTMHRARVALDLEQRHVRCPINA